MRMSCICIWNFHVYDREAGWKGTSMTDIILDTLLDTAKLIPFLFLTYLD